MRMRLKSDRLVLRPQTAQDAPAMAEHMGHYDFAKMTGSIPMPFLLHAAEMRIMLNTIKRRQGLRHVWAISRHGEDQWMGNVALFRGAVDSTWEIGYGLGAPYQGRGYMREALAAVLREVDMTLQPDELLANVYTDNGGSIALLEDFGFVQKTPEKDVFCLARDCRVSLFSYARTTPQTVDATLGAVS